MGDMEKEEAVKKTPAITISPSFLYGVTSGVKVILSSFPIHLASSFAQKLAEDDDVVFWMYP